MPTVSYKHQPGIAASHGHVPLAGDSHLYTVAKVLWPDSVSDVLRALFVGRTLHVCCGKSPLGDVRIDLDPAHMPDIVADAACLQNVVGTDEFDTVLCDPPYNGKFQWNHDVLVELARVAARRIIFQHWFIPATSQGFYKKAQEKFALTQVYIWQPRTYFGRAQIVSVFDRSDDAEQLLSSR